jgi:hypothetical protein
MEFFKPIASILEITTIMFFSVKASRIAENEDDRIQVDSSMNDNFKFW